jgi:hypothetical protein
MKLEWGSMRPHQQEVLKMVYRSLKDGKIAFVYGGMGTFKSSTMIFGLYQWLWYLSGYYTNLVFYVAALHSKQLKGAFLNSWHEQVPKAMYNYNQQSNIITLKGTSTEIILTHTGDSKEGAAARKAADGLKGATAIGYYFPQAELVPESFYHEIRNRCRGEPTPINRMKRPPCRLYMLDANPAEENHWLKRYFLDSGEESLKARCNTMQLVTTPETSAYTQEEIDEAKRILPDYQFQRNYLGEFAGSAGRAFILQSGHFTDEPLANGRWHLSFDFCEGGNDDFYVGLFQVEHAKIWLCDEAYHTGGFYDDHLACTMNLLSRHPDIEISSITGDYAGMYHPTGRTTVNALRQFGEVLDVPVVGTVKSRIPGWKRVAQYLAPPTQGPTRFDFTLKNSCVYMREAVALCEYDEKGDIEPHPKDHAIDPLRYLMMSRIPLIHAAEDS